MEKLAHAAPRWRQKRLACARLSAVLAGVICCGAGSSPASAASLSPGDLQLLVRAVGFMQPPPGGGVVAIVHAVGDPASRADAEAIAAEFGDGLRLGAGLLRARVVDVAAFAQGGFVLAIAAAGANGDALGAAARAAHVLCVTADLAAVQAGFCTMALRAEPRVDIVLNHAATEASGINFAVAFRMMIRER